MNEPRCVESDFLRFLSKVEKCSEASDVDSWIDDFARDAKGFLEFEES